MLGTPYSTTWLHQYHGEDSFDPILQQVWAVSSPPVSPLLAFGGN